MPNICLTSLKSSPAPSNSWVLHSTCPFLRCLIRLSSRYLYFLQLKQDIQSGRWVGFSYSAVSRVWRRTMRKLKAWAKRPYRTELIGYGDSSGHSLAECLGLPKAAFLEHPGTERQSTENENELQRWLKKRFKRQVAFVFVVNCECNLTCPLGSAGYRVPRMRQQFWPLMLFRVSASFYSTVVWKKLRIKLLDFFLSPISHKLSCKKTIKT